MSAPVSASPWPPLLSAKDRQSVVERKIDRALIDIVSGFFVNNWPKDAVHPYFQAVIKAVANPKNEIYPSIPRVKELMARLMDICEAPVAKKNLMDHQDAYDKKIQDLLVGLEQTKDIADPEVRFTKAQNYHHEKIKHLLLKRNPTDLKSFIKSIFHAVSETGYEELWSPLQMVTVLRNAAESKNCQGVLNWLNNADNISGLKNLFSSFLVELNKQPRNIPHAIRVEAAMKTLQKKNNNTDTLKDAAFILNTLLLLLSSILSGS